MFDRNKKLLGLKETIRCSKCNRLNDDDDIYCIYCGNKLPTPKKIRSDTTTKKCPKCGNHNPKNSNYCEECGTKLVKTTKYTKTQTQKDEIRITCPNCKKSFRKESYTYEKYNRCPHCQYNFKTQKVHDPQINKNFGKEGNKCPKCGNHNPKNSNYCEECGTKLVKTTKYTKTQTQKDEIRITCPNCKKSFRKESYTYEKYNRCPHCQYDFKTQKVHLPQTDKILGKEWNKCPKCGHIQSSKIKNCAVCGNTLNTQQENVKPKIKTKKCPHCNKTFDEEGYSYSTFKKCPFCKYEFKTRIKPQTIRENSQVKKPNIQTQIADEFKIPTTILNQYCQKHGTTTVQLLNEIQEEEAYEKIDKLGGTNYIKQQLKTKTSYQIAKEYNIPPTSIQKYCQKRGTTTVQPLNEIIEEEERKRKAYERIDNLGGTNYIKQQLKTKNPYNIAKEHNINPSDLYNYCNKHDTTLTNLQKEIQEEEAYKKIDNLGGTNYIKQQLKTKKPSTLAQEYHLNYKSLNEYCQKHGTSINQLQKEIQEEEAYKIIDNLGGTNYIKQQLKTKNPYNIAKEHNINPSDLYNYCNKHDTSINQLQKEIQEEEAYKKIDNLGGTNYIKQQLKTKNTNQIAKEYKLTLENLNDYCKKHYTTLTKLSNEIIKEKDERKRNAYEKIDRQGGTNYIKQQLKTNNAGQIAKKFNISIASLYNYCNKHGTTINQLQKEIQEEKTYEKIGKLGGTNYIKLQLKTKSSYQIAQEHNINPSDLNKYCQKHDTTIDQLQKEIQEEEAYKKIDKLGGTNYIKQQLKTQTQTKIAKKFNLSHANLNKYCKKHNTTLTNLQKEIQEEKTYEKIDKLGGTNYIKQQLKTKSSYKIAQEHKLTRENLNAYCQKHGTAIEQLLNEILEEETYEKIDKLGGTNYLKQQLKTKSAKEIAQRHNINQPYLNKYCREHNTTIDKLLNEIEHEIQEKQERQRQDRYMQNLKNEKRMRDY